MFFNQYFSIEYIPRNDQEIPFWYNVFYGFFAENGIIVTNKWLDSNSKVTLAVNIYDFMLG